MAGEKGEKGVTDAIKPLIERIVDIFGVFDLSFFVAGSVCFAAVLFAVYAFGGGELLASLKPPDGDFKSVHVVGAVLASYVLGMVCFALGAVRRRFGKGGRDVLAEQIEKHKLTGTYGKPTTADEKDRIYTLMWVEARQNPALTPSFNLLMRYWVMAAMCDGLIVAWLVWALVWAIWSFSSPDVLPMTLGIARLHAPLAWTGELAFVGAAYLCFLEARQYSKYQIYELVATLAYVHPPEPKPSE